MNIKELLWGSLYYLLKMIVFLVDCIPWFFGFLGILLMISGEDRGISLIVAGIVYFITEYYVGEYLNRKGCYASKK